MGRFAKKYEEFFPACIKIVLHVSIFYNFSFEGSFFFFQNVQFLSRRKNLIFHVCIKTIIVSGFFSETLKTNNKIVTNFLKRYSRFLLIAKIMCN